MNWLACLFNPAFVYLRQFSLSIRKHPLNFGKLQHLHSAYMNELVSIIIPCFNAEQWVGDAIRSSLKQSWKDIEVIVIDDGSTDASLDVVRSFGASIQYEASKNLGGCAARNMGLRLARGRWIQFLDADDILDPHCIERKLDAICDDKVIICSRVELMAGYERKKLPAPWGHSFYDLQFMLRHGSPQTSAPLHQAEVLRSVGGFREGLVCAQEFDLHLRLAIQTGCVFKSIDYVGVSIRPCLGSLSRTAGRKMPLTTGAVLTSAVEELNSCDMATPMLCAAAAQHMGQLARSLWRFGARREAAQLAEFAMKTSPRWSSGNYSGSLSEFLVRAIGFKGFEYLRSFSGPYS